MCKSGPGDFRMGNKNSILRKKIDLNPLKTKNCINVLRYVVLPVTPYLEAAYGIILAAHV